MGVISLLDSMNPTANVPYTHKKFKRAQSACESPTTTVPQINRAQHQSPPPQPPHTPSESPSVPSIPSALSVPQFKPKHLDAAEVPSNPQFKRGQLDAAEVPNSPQFKRGQLDTAEVPSSPQFKKGHEIEVPAPQFKRGHEEVPSSPQVKRGHEEVPSSPQFKRYVETSELSSPQFKRGHEIEVPAPQFKRGHEASEVPQLKRYETESFVPQFKRGQSPSLPQTEALESNGKTEIKSEIKTESPTKYPLHNGYQANSTHSLQGPNSTQNSAHNSTQNSQNTPGFSQSGSEAEEVKRKSSSGGKYKCDYCGLGCAKPSVLGKHIRTHTNERPFSCDQCSIAFKTKSNYLKHTRSQSHKLRCDGGAQEGSDGRENSDVDVDGEDRYSSPDLARVMVSSPDQQKITSSIPGSASIPRVEPGPQMQPTDLSISPRDHNRSDDRGSSIYKPKFRHAYTDDGKVGLSHSAQENTGHTYQYQAQNYPQTNPQVNPQTNPQANMAKGLPPLDIHAARKEDPQNAHNSQQGVSSIWKGIKSPSPEIVGRHITKLIVENQAIVDTHNPLWSRRYKRQSSIGSSSSESDGGGSKSRRSSLVESSFKKVGQGASGAPSGPPTAPAGVTGPPVAATGPPVASSPLHTRERSHSFSADAPLVERLERQQSPYSPSLPPTNLPLAQTFNRASKTSISLQQQQAISTSSTQPHPPPIIDPSDPRQRAMSEGPSVVREVQKNRMIEDPRNRMIEDPRNKIIEDPRNKMIEDPRNKMIEDPRNKMIEDPRNRIENRMIEESRNRIENRMIEESRNRMIEDPRNRMIEDPRNKMIEDSRNRMIEESRNRLIEETRNRIESRMMENRMIEERMVQSRTHDGSVIKNLMETARAGIASAIDQNLERHERARMSNPAINMSNPAIPNPAITSDTLVCICPRCRTPFRNSEDLDNHMRHFCQRRSDTPDSIKSEGRWMEQDEALDLQKKPDDRERSSSRGASISEGHRRGSQDDPRYLRDQYKVYRSKSVPDGVAQIKRKISEVDGSDRSMTFLSPGYPSKGPIYPGVKSDISLKIKDDLKQNKLNNLHLFGGEVQIHDGNELKTMRIDPSKPPSPAVDIRIPPQQLGGTSKPESTVPTSVVVTIAKSGLNSGGTMVQVDGKTSTSSTKTVPSLVSSNLRPENEIPLSPNIEAARPPIYNTPFSNFLQYAPHLQMPNLAIPGIPAPDLASLTFSTYSPRPNVGLLQNAQTSHLLSLAHKPRPSVNRPLPSTYPSKSHPFHPVTQPSPQPQEHKERKEGDMKLGEIKRNEIEMKRNEIEMKRNEIEMKRNEIEMKRNERNEIEMKRDDHYRVSSKPMSASYPTLIPVGDEKVPYVPGIPGPYSQANIVPVNSRTVPGSFASHLAVPYVAPTHSLPSPLPQHAPKPAIPRARDVTRDPPSSPQHAPPITPIPSIYKGRLSVGAVRPEDIPISSTSRMSPKEMNTMSRPKPPQLPQPPSLTPTAVTPTITPSVTLNPTPIMTPLPSSSKIPEVKTTPEIRIHPVSESDKGFVEKPENKKGDTKSDAESPEEFLPPRKRPNFLELKPQQYTNKSSLALIGTTLVSPDTPRPKKSCVQMLLNGSAYTYLGHKVSTKSYFCCIYRQQPMYVPQSTDPKLSMYSNWQLRKPAEENPLKLNPYQAMGLYESRKYDRSYTIAKSKELNLIQTHSSYWTFKEEKEKKEPETNIKTEEVSIDGEETRIKQENEEEDGVKMSQGESSDGGSSAKRIKIFEGGYKSTEDYTYVRGRGRGRYVCETCGIRCKKPSMLKKHIRTHTDLRPYACRHCSFSFKTKGNLTKHLRSKAHDKRCEEMGVIPVPTVVDDSHINHRALALQGKLEQEGRRDSMDCDDDDDDDDDDEDDDGEDDDEDDDEITQFQDARTHSPPPIEGGSDNEGKEERKKEGEAKEGGKVGMWEGDRGPKGGNRDGERSGSIQNPSSESEKEKVEQAGDSPMDLSVKKSSNPTNLSSNSTNISSNPTHLSSIPIMSSSSTSLSSNPTVGSNRIGSNPNLSAEKAAMLRKSPNPRRPSFLPIMTRSSVPDMRSPISMTSPATPSTPIREHPSEILSPVTESSTLLKSIYNTTERASKSREKPHVVPDPTKENGKSSSMLQAYLKECAVLDTTIKRQQYKDSDTSPDSPNLSGPEMATNKGQHHKVEKRDASSWPEKREGGSWPKKNEGGSWPKKNDGGPWPEKRDGGSWPEKREGGSLPKKSEGGPWPEKREGGSWPKKSEGSPWPEKRDGGSWPEKKDGGSWPKKSEEGPCPPNSSPSPSPSPSLKPELQKKKLSKNSDVNSKSAVENIKKTENGDIEMKDEPKLTITNTSSNSSSENSVVNSSSNSSSIGSISLTTTSTVTTSLSRMPTPPANLTVVNSRGVDAKTAFLVPSGVVPSSLNRAGGDEGKCRCGLCHKEFNKPSQLSIHMNIHYMERPYRCDSCAVSFRTNGHLMKHKRSVSHFNKVNINMTFGTPSTDNPRPFKCRDCKIAFRIHGHLAKHLRSKMHIMKLECLGKLPFGTYAEMERSGANLNEIDTTDCDNSLESLKALALRLYERDPSKLTAWQTQHTPRPRTISNSSTSSDDYPMQDDTDDPNINNSLPNIDEDNNNSDGEEDEEMPLVREPVRLIGGNGPTTGPNIPTPGPSHTHTIEVGSGATAGLVACHLCQEKFLDLEHLSGHLFTVHKVSVAYRNS